MNDVEYSVTIQPSKNLEAKVFFDTEQEKGDYVIEESMFCRKTENDYLSSSGKEREEKKRAFLQRRVDFAKKSGYAPVKGNKAIWKKTEETTTTKTGPKGAA